MRIDDLGRSGAPIRQSSREVAAPSGRGREFVSLSASVASFLGFFAAAAAACCWIELGPDLASSRDFGPSEFPVRAIFGAESSNDGESVLVYCSDGRLEVFGAAERRGELPVTDVTAAVWTADGRSLVTGHADGEIRVWDLSDRNDSNVRFAETAVFEAHGAAVRALAVSEDGRYAVSGDAEGLIVFRSLATGAVEWATNEARSVNDVAISPAGDAIAFACDGRPNGLYRPVSGVVRRIMGDAGRGRSLRFSPCGSRLLSGRFDGGITCWDVSADRLLWASAPVGVDDPVRSLAVSVDGKTAAGSQREDITLWDMERGHALGTLASSGDAAVSLRFIAHDRLLQSCSRDGCARLWDLSAPSEPIVWQLFDPIGGGPLARIPDDAVATTSRRPPRQRE